MPIVYSTSLQNARMQIVADTIDTGTGGVLVIGTAALSGATGVLAAIPLEKPCGTVGGVGVLTFDVPVSVVATADGVAAKAEIRDSSGNVAVSGLTVGVADSGADIIMGSVNISAGQVVEVTLGSFTHG